MKNVPVHNSVHQDFSKNAEDSVSNFIMSEYSFESKSALFSTGDGDCLFNSVSIFFSERRVNESGIKVYMLH